MSPEPRTSMTCRLCGGFSSASTCWSCSQSPVYLHYAVAQSKVQELTEQVQSLERSLAQARAEAIEECAKVCEGLPERTLRVYETSGGSVNYLVATTPKDFAAAIRSLAPTLLPPAERDEGEG